MTYTPINWQNGDTITAEKMNKMDNGWAVGSSLTTCFDGNITTTDGDNREATIDVTTGDFSAASEITVTLDGTVYNLTGFNDGGFWTWGAPYNDFSQYSFSIYYQGGVYTFLSQTAGTYALKIQSVVLSAETSEAFAAAVNSYVQAAGAFRCVDGVTSYEDANLALNEGKLLYFIADVQEMKHCFIISVIGSPCVITPTSNTISARFGRDTGIFYVSVVTA